MNANANDVLSLSKGEIHVVNSLRAGLHLSTHGGRMRQHSPAEACYDDELNKVIRRPSKDQGHCSEERGSAAQFIPGNRCIY